MIKVAISGNIAAGKSSVEEILRKRGFLVFDSDKISHELLDLSKNEVISAFEGYDILENAEISRKKLGNLVFADKNKKEKLEKILHPKIKKEINNIFEKNNNKKLIFVSVPLLFELKWEKLFDKILFVDTDEAIRLERLMKRDNITLEQAKLRINSQNHSSEKIKNSDFIICNNGDSVCLQKNIDEIIILLEDSIGEIR